MSKGFEQRKIHSSYIARVYLSLSAESTIEKTWSLPSEMKGNISFNTFIFFQQQLLDIEQKLPVLPLQGLCTIE